MSPIKCFDKEQFLSSDGEGVIHSSTCFSMKPQVEQEKFAPNYSKWSVLAPAWSSHLLASVKGSCRDLLAHLHAQTLFAQIGEDYLKRDLCRNCYTSGNHGSNWKKVSFLTENYKTCADFDRTAWKSVFKKCTYWKNHCSMWMLTKFHWRTVCPNRAKVTWARFTVLFELLPTLSPVLFKRVSVGYRGNNFASVGQIVPKFSIFNYNLSRVQQSKVWLPVIFKYEHII